MSAPTSQAKQSRKQNIVLHPSMPRREDMISLSQESNRETSVLETLRSDLILPTVKVT